MPLSSVVGAQSIIKPGVCTSSTRPAVPFEGQMIYETDTDKVLVYNGTAWYPNWNTAWGQVGLQTITSIFTTSATHTTFQDTGMTLNVTEVNGRCYKITASSNIYAPGGVQSIEMRLLRNAATLKQNNFPDSVMNSGNSLGTVTMTWVHTSTASGSATFKMQMRAGASNTSVSDYGDATFPRQFFVEDIGPA